MIDHASTLSILTPIHCLLSMTASLVWLRRDLRLADNPALAAALASRQPIILLYILDDDLTPQPGGAARWWLENSLYDLGRRSAALGCPLTLRRGAALAILREICGRHDVKTVYWNRLYEPAAIDRDREIKTALRADGLTCESFNGTLLHEPWSVKTADDRFYRVFTPFWKTCLALPDPPFPIPAPDRITGLTPAPNSDHLSDWHLYPGRPDWAAGMRDAWTPGETAATHTLEHFLDQAADYAKKRDHPGVMATSRLSPYLSLGEISAGQIWHHVRTRQHQHPEAARSLDKFLSEIGWREFSYNLLFHYPQLPSQPLRPEFDAFPWQDDLESLRAWQQGQTGYPIVDAGMRELWATGYMHNRVRMIAASFLVKDLMIPWQKGADWFWDTLCDADLANNSASWQWVAGCGADAAPYFRIFNPSLQSAKYDPEGDYIRRWVPEIAALPATGIHQPWLASPTTLAEAGVTLGQTYPWPMIDHATARQTALAAYQNVKAGNNS